MVPGGFGNRGIEGMILAAGYARNRNIPYLGEERERECGNYDFILCHCIGVCLGMQTAVIEFARNVLEWRGILFSSNCLKL